MKQFFGINEKFRFELADLSAILTILNVSLILAGIKIAPLFGLTNCFLGLIFPLKNHYHINWYATSFALIVLNIYFLMG